jgi:hypothetical protein
MASARARETRAADEGFSRPISLYRRAARSFHAFASLRHKPGLDVAEGGINWRGAWSLMISPRSRRHRRFYLGNRRPCIPLAWYTYAINIGTPSDYRRGGVA